MLQKIRYIIMYIYFHFSPNFFILDEPTNHLDMETIEALGLALKTFAVSIIIIHMIQAVCYPPSPPSPHLTLYHAKEI